MQCLVFLVEAEMFENQCGQMCFKIPLFFTENFQACGGSVFTQLIYCFDWCSNCMFKRRKLLHLN